MSRLVWAASSRPERLKTDVIWRPLMSWWGSKRRPAWDVGWKRRPLLLAWSFARCARSGRLGRCWHDSSTASRSRATIPLDFVFLELHSPSRCVREGARACNSMGFAVRSIGRGCLLFSGLAVRSRGGLRTLLARGLRRFAGEGHLLGVFSVRGGGRRGT